MCIINTEHMFDKIKQRVKNVNIECEYLDIDMKIQCVGMCEKCGDPIMENERIIRTEEGLCCENCNLQEECS